MIPESRDFVKIFFEQAGENAHTPFETPRAGAYSLLGTAYLCRS